MTKQEIRKNVRDRLSVCDLQAGAHSAIWGRIESFQGFAEAQTLLVYWSIGFEVPTSDFICRWCDEKRIVLPVVEGNDLLLREYKPLKMKVGYRGILEPSGDSALVAPSEVDFAIVPGVAFDKKNNRMGRGKGFYDRLLPQLRKDCPKVGVCWSEQLFDEIPVDEWDVPLFAVITP